MEFGLAELRREQMGEGEDASVQRGRGRSREAKRRDMNAAHGERGRRQCPSILVWRRMLLQRARQRRGRGEQVRRSLGTWP
jgi:hypothetical protein